MNDTLLTTEPEKLTFYIRQIESEEIPVCAALDSAYQTDYVWQMSLLEEDHLVQSVFSRVKLPRTMTVESWYTPQQAQLLLTQAGGVFVACYNDEIIACIGGTVESWRGVLMIESLVVQPAFRRRGVAKRLLRVIKAFAYDNHCKRLSVISQTKNHPAIAFARQQGFVFCGYNDKYYPNGDIALMFSLNL